MTINLNAIGRYASDNGSEIPAFDVISKRLFIVAGNVVEILNLVNPNNPNKIGDLAFDFSAVENGFELIPNSVAVGKKNTVSEGIVAVALAIKETATGNQAKGEVQFFNASTGIFLGKQTVGFLPDMVTFTPDGTKILTANEGEPNEDYTFDPVGSVSIINLTGGVVNAITQEASFVSFNSQIHSLKAQGVRIFGPNATVAQDVEPEYMAFSANGTKAWVTLQENNAIAIVDIATATIEEIKPLGFKNHSLEGNGIDASDRDDTINIRNVPVFGMYLPDAIASYTVNGETYYITANEGDGRVRPTSDDILPEVEEGDIYNEEIRLGNDDYILDPVAFPNGEELKENINLGRLTVTNTLGDTDGDGDFDEIYAFGSRSFSIWHSNGNLVFDSGEDFERITAQALPNYFNASNSNNNFDDRSDNKGPEPEGVTVGKIQGKTYAFVSLERIGGVMVYEVTNPNIPEFVQYINTRNFEEDPETNLTDSGPEGLTFIDAENSPNGIPLLIVSNEVSNTTNIYQINDDFTSETNNPQNLLHDSLFRFRTGNGTYLYVGETEKQNILQSNFGFVEEGEAFKVSFEADDKLIPIYRFRNNNLKGAYLYVGEGERQTLLNNNSGFMEEGLAFYTYGTNTEQAQDIYRLQTVQGGYMFVGEQERQNILQNNLSFQQEGIAFEALI